MAVTTNYNWTTPDDVDLVKDGAAAIRTLGSSADTTVKALNPGTTAGDIDYYTTSTAKARIGIGTAGQVLAVNSGATAPEWVTASGGGLTLIQETVASANSSISFTGIAGTYKQLLLVWHGIYHTGSTSTFSVRFNNSSTANTYTMLKMSGTGNSAFSSQYGDSSYIEGLAPAYNPTPFGIAVNNSTTALFTQATGYLLVDDYASTTKNKFFHTSYGFYKNSATAGYTNLIGNGTWINTAAITSVDIVRIAGSDNMTNATNTSIRLYGVA